MSNATPDSADKDVVDLSKNHDWQLRLLEARARRAEASKEANEQAAPTGKKAMPQKEQDKVLPPLQTKKPEAPRELDFHDRVNRFKRISRIQPPRERTPEEIALIEAKLSGNYVPPASGGAPVAPKILGDGSNRVKSKPVERRKAPETASITPKKTPAPKALGVPDDQPEEVFTKKVVPAFDDKPSKPIERAQTRIIWFAEPEEENIKMAVAKTMELDAAESEPVIAPAFAPTPQTSADEVETMEEPSRLRIATGLAAIGSMLLAAAAFIIPMGR